MFNTTVLLLFFCIVTSLAAGFFFLLTEKPDSTKLLSALKVRIALTALMMVLIVSLWLTNHITPTAPWLQ